MLKNIIHGQYEAVKTRVQNVSGSYVATAATPEQAQFLAAAQRLWDYVQEKYGNDPKVMADVKSMLESAKN